MSKKFLLLIITAAAILLPASVTAAGEMGLNVNPDQVNIGISFKGTTLEVSGSVPAGSEIFLKFESPPGTVSLNRKGKVGPLWMTVDNVQAENVPKIYEVFTSGSLAGLSQKARDLMEIGADYNYLKEHARVTRRHERAKEVLGPEEADTYFNGLFDIYQKRGYYKIDEGALQVVGGRFQATLDVPTGIPPGSSNITAYAVQGDRVIKSETFPLLVNSVGLVGWVRSEATLSGPFYGLIATIVALAVGLAIGILFSSLGRKKGLQADGGH